MVSQSRFLPLVMMAAVAAANPGQAEVYRWVDEQGRVHFGDRPASSADRSRVEVIDSGSAGRGNSSGPMGTRQVRTADPIPYAGTGDSRKVRLDKIIVNLDSEEGGNIVIGHKHAGIGCSRKTGGFYWSRGSIRVSGDQFRSQFEKELQANRYSVEQVTEALFDGQQSRPAELVLAALITAMELNECDLSRMRGKVRIASYIQVEWQLFDPLTRQVVYKSTTDGSDNGTYDRTLGDATQRSQAGAFRNAVTNLLADEAFVAALGAEGGVDNGTAAVAAPESAPVTLHYGDQGAQFLDVVDGLKRATVVVRSPHGHGSGFFISADGYALTNSHVTGGAEYVMLFWDEHGRKARVIHTDPVRDVALLKLVEPLRVPQVAISRSPPKSGYPVYLIGTPLDENLSHTVTQGIISAERRLDDGNRYYQTDASINPGNSGGPAFNRYGEVVGMAVSGMFSRGGGSLNINFLIPVEEALTAVNLN